MMTVATTETKIDRPRKVAHRGVWVELWQGNDNEGRLGYLPWYWRPTNEPHRSQINWSLYGPDRTIEAALDSAHYVIDKHLDRFRWITNVNLGG